MKKLLALLTVFTCTVMTTTAQTEAPAFPGAEGHGRYVTGGRGGQVIHVTNLNDNGPGSFRQAVNSTRKKIIVFDVGGVIALNSDVKIGGNTTILGQTAPAPGITLRYYTVNPNGDNIIMRFIRIRRGQEKNVNDGADASTAKQFTGIVLDHCSFSWSIDEVASFYDNNNFTMQWCTIAESLNNAGHEKGAHGYGGIWGGKLASFHHNLIAHVNNRSPRFNGARYNWNGYTKNKLYGEYQWANTLQAENVDFRNCVIYNCGNGCYGGPGGGQVNIVNNYYKSGPTATTSRITTVSMADSGNGGNDQTFWNMTSRYFIEGNTVYNNSNVTNNNWSGISYDSGVPTYGGAHYTYDPNHYFGAGLSYTSVNGKDALPIKLDTPAPIGEITTHTAQNAYIKVLKYSGASLNQDEVDQRYFTEALNGTATYTGSVTNTKGRIDKVSDVNGYTEANFGTGSHPAGFDTDEDGIPDAWETANGLNPNSKSDGVSYTLDPAHFYTNLEVYANSLVQDIMLEGNKDAATPANEYYPKYTKTDGSVVEAINTLGVDLSSSGNTQEQGEYVSYTIAKSTNTGSNTSSSYEFESGDITVTNGSSKSYATGNNDGIKYSANTQYTIHLPENVSISRATFSGYDNYGDLDAYLGEVAGESYANTKYVFPKKDGNNAVPASHSIEFAPAVTDRLTFTPKGKQVVLTITLTGNKSSASGISTVSTGNQIVKTEYYDLNGRRLVEPGRGLSIRVERRADGKTVTTKVAR